MSEILYIATVDGFHIAEDVHGVWKVSASHLPGEHVTSIVSTRDTIVAGTSRGIRRSVDRGNSWQAADGKLARLHVRWLSAPAGQSSVVLAGTEPAGIFVSHDGGFTWRWSHEVEVLRDRLGWFLPYSANAGCVRGFAASGSGSRTPRIVAAVEVGGVLYSDDGGRSWQLVAGPADGVAKNGRIEVSTNGGQSWRQALHGLPTPWANHMVDRFVQIEGRLYAVLSNGELWHTTTRIATWERTLPDVSGITAVRAR